MWEGVRLQCLLKVSSKSSSVWEAQLQLSEHCSGEGCCQPEIFFIVRTQRQTQHASQTNWSAQAHTHSWQVKLVKHNTPVWAGKWHSDINCLKNCSSDFRKSGQQKTKWNVFFANRIQATLGGGLKCDSNQISADASQSQISKCLLLTRNVTHNDNIKSRATEVHQSGWAEPTLLLAERGHRERPSVIVWRARWWISTRLASASERPTLG